MDLLLKVILIVIMLISFMGVVAESKPDLRQALAFICIASIAATVSVFIWL